MRIVQKPKKELHDLIEAFKQLPDHIHTTIIPLSNPLNDDETKAVRKLFSQAGLDTSDVADEQIRYYISSLMEGAYRYYIDFDHSKTYAPIAIKPITSHPQYNPTWQDHKIDLAAIPDSKEYTAADFTIKELRFT
ncbi:hypothetical protein [Sediminibacterium ginsengisoli]|uniref:hypothetical protein n=1 Tax=Sediminibacterium ginsengisoli TaxID=413434 RepID=UPI00158FC396|nr:hypothetical protein [Sediminibacterium ginsengisoli]